MFTSTFVPQNSHKIYSTTNSETVKELCLTSEVDKLFGRFLDISRYTVTRSTLFSRFVFDLYVLLRPSVFSLMKLDKYGPSQVLIN